MQYIYHNFDDNILIWTNCVVFFYFFQVVEKVTIFVMDTNDEKPEFQNMPAIIDVLEVRWIKLLYLYIKRFNKCTFSAKLSSDCGYVCVAHFRQLNQEVASTKWRLWTETQAQEAQLHTISRYDVCWKKINIFKLFSERGGSGAALHDAQNVFPFAIFWGKCLNFIPCSTCTWCRDYITIPFVSGTKWFDGCFCSMWQGILVCSLDYWVWRTAGLHMLKSDDLEVFKYG